MTALYHAPVMHGDNWIDQVVPECAKRAILVAKSQPAILDHCAAGVAARWRVSYSRHIAALQ
jgi:hypothetical protein